MQHIIMTLFTLLMLQNLHAGPFSINGATTSYVSVGTCTVYYPLAIHFTGPTTAQIHTEVTNKGGTGTPNLTLISTGAKFGTAIQLTRGVSTGMYIDGSQDCFPFSITTCYAVMFWVMLDTYSATVSQESFIWGMQQSGGGACFGFMGDFDDVLAANNGYIGFVYNPNGTGYDKFQGSRYRCLPGEWHHVIQVTSRYNRIMKEFIDGKKETDADGSGENVVINKTATPTNAPLNFNVGTYAGIANSIQGKIDDFILIKTSTRTFTDEECVQWYRDAVNDRQMRGKPF